MKTTVFIDGANIYYHIREHDLRIDFSRLIEELLDKNDQLLGAHYFNASSGQEGLEGFFKVLSDEGIQLHIQDIPHPIGQNDTGRQQKGVDVDLAVVATAAAPSFDKAIIVSGDADFKPVADYLRSIGKMVVFASFKETLSKSLNDYRTIDLAETIKAEGVSWKKKFVEIKNVI